MDDGFFWRSFSPELRSKLEADSKAMVFKRGETIYRQGEVPRGIYVVKTGLVGLTLVGSSSGREHLLRFFRHDHFFGHRALFSDEGYHGTTIALEPTELSLIPRDAILAALAQQPSALREIVKTLARELRRCETQHVLILENQIVGRVAQALIYLKDLHPGHNWTRQEIANFCASTVSTVIKTLSQIEDLGLIRQDGRSIDIVDREGLMRLQEAEV